MSTDPQINPYAALPFHFWTATFFAFGSIVGSFLNVCIHRLPRDLSVVHPPSHCPTCKYQIPWFLNIPILTWLMIGGRCSNCQSKISPRYLLVELLTGVLFATCWIAFGKISVGLSIAYAIVLAGFIAATFTDFEHFIIPNEISFTGMILGLIASAALPVLHGADTWLEGLKHGAIGLAAGAGIVYAVLRFGKLMFGRYHVDFEQGKRMIFTENDLILPTGPVPYGEFFFRKSDYIRFHADRLEMVDRCFQDVDVEVSSHLLRIGDEEFDPEPIKYMCATTSTVQLPREAMGLGDVKFMGAIGAFLGWKAVVFSLIGSSLVGALVGIGLISMGKRDWSSRLPYGPYIALAATIWIFYSQPILARFVP